MLWFSSIGLLLSLYMCVLCMCVVHVCVVYVCIAHVCVVHVFMGGGGGARAHVCGFMQRHDVDVRCFP